MEQARLHKTSTTMTKKIATLITDGFDDVEYAKPVNAFKKAGHEIVNVGLKKGKIVIGTRLRIRIDQSVKGVSSSDFDALLIPGGYSPDELRAHDDAVRFAKGFMDHDKPVFAICHGVQILITAQTLSGRKATGWKSISQDIRNAGAAYIDKAVVEDRNLVTSRSYPDIPAFVRASLKKLE